MTTARNDETVDESELVHVDMEIAGPPGRPGRDDAPTVSRRRRLLGGLVIATFVAPAIVVVATRWPVEDATPSTPAHHTAHRAASEAATVSPTDALEALPHGGPPRVPYLLDGSLHVDDLTVPSDGNRLLSAGDTTLVGHTDGDTARWWVLDGAELAPVRDLEGVRTPVLAPSGRILAWTAYPDSRTTRIVAWDPGTRSGVAHVDIDAPQAECCGGGQLVELLGFDLADQLYLTDRGHDLQWRPDEGGPLRRLIGVDDVVGIAPVGPVRQGGTLGRADVRGLWSPVAELPADQGTAWSSDGTLVATGQWVLDPTTGTRTDLDVPDGLGGEAVGFESDEWVLVEVVVQPRRHALLRCSVDDGSCETALAPGTDGWLLPERATW
jgi:hypothetical protein